MSAFAQPYARAFLESAPGGYDMEGFIENARAISRAVHENPMLRAFLASPAVPQDAKLRTVRDLARKTGIDDLGSRFLGLVLKHHRILELPAILQALRDDWDKQRGVVEGRVIVAAPIGDAEKGRLEEALAARLGGAVRLRVEVDPEILAGFVAHVGSSVFDSSAIRQIERFGETVKAKGSSGA